MTIITALIIAVMAEYVSYKSLSEAEQKQTPVELISQNKNQFMKRFTEDYNCNFIETIKFHPVLGFIHRTNEFTKPECKAKVNNIGVQSIEDLPLTKNEQDFNIIILGGSVATALYHYRINSPRPFLENILNQRFIPPAGKKRFHIYQGALGQWAMPNQVNMLQMYGERVDAAIVVDGYNESLTVFNGKRHEANNLPTLFSSIKSYKDPFFKKIEFYRNTKEFILNSSLSKFYISVIFTRFLTARIQDYIVSSDIEKEFTLNAELFELKHEAAQTWSLKSLERYIKNFHTLAQSNNIQVAHFFQPNRFFGKTLTENEKAYADYLDLKTMTRVSDMYDNLSLKNHSIVNLKNLFINERGDIYTDHIHYIADPNTKTSKGFNLMVDAISDNLQTIWKLKSK